MRQTLVTDEKVIEEVKKHIGEALRLDSATITIESSLIKDLGAESLDFLDINYRLEQAFGIKMARHFVIEHVEELFGEGTAVDENSQLTEKGARLLKIRLGHNLNELKTGMNLDEVSSLITVHSLARNVMDILDTLPENCAQCRGQSWSSDDGLRIKCGTCGAPAAFKNGDDLIKDWLKQIQEEHRIF